MYKFEQVWGFVPKWTKLNMSGGGPYIGRGWGKGIPCDLWLTTGITGSGHMQTPPPRWQKELQIYTTENITFPQLC